MPTAEAVFDAPAASPLDSDELVALFRPLAGARRIAIAVSGGADSLALLDGVDRWRKAPGRPEVVVLTVDHRLRTDSATAAEAVRAVAAERDLVARVLVREGPPPASDVENAARIARYRLLFGACRALQADHLVVAHHQGDVAETFLMRLKRDAGIFGLAAMRPVIPVGDATLVRPFLSVPRARLAATTAAAGWQPIDDPMNHDPRFQRAAVRRFLAEGGLDTALLASLGARFADLADAIDAEATIFMATAVTADEAGVAWLDAARFADAPPAVRDRVLVRLLLAVGGADYPPRFSRLSALHRAMLDADGGANLKRTLAGAVVERRGGHFSVYREAGRCDLPTVPIEPGHLGVWDHRFAVTVAKDAPPGLMLGPLGEGQRSLLPAGTRRAPFQAVAALPVLRRGGKIVAAPWVLDGEPRRLASFRCLLAERLSRPPLFPDFATG